MLSYIHDHKSRQTAMIERRYHKSKEAACKASKLGAGADKSTGPRKWWTSGLHSLVQNGIFDDANDIAKLFTELISKY